MPKQSQLILLVIVVTRIQELDIKVSSFLSQNAMLENVGLLFEKASCQQDEALLTLPTVIKCY
jgi:hypothetical protein